jgi:cell division septation protein DedD
MRRLAGLWILVVLSVADPVEAKTDREIKLELIRQSLSSYSGNCPCPYNTDRAGRRCGKRSAYSRPGGRSPLCYESDVTTQMVADYRRSLGGQQERGSTTTSNVARTLVEERARERQIPSSRAAPMVETERSPIKADSHPYLVQVGAFKRLGQTDDLTAQLSREGYEHVVLPGSDYFRVLVGPFETEASALVAKSKLERQGHSGYIRNDIGLPSNR